MDCSEEKQTSSNSKLEHVAKRLKSDEAQCILQSEKSSDCEKSLLNAAVDQNNLELIKKLLDNGCEDKDKNVALLTALKYMNFEAVKMLLNADADVRIVDELSGKTAFAILLTRRRNRVEIVQKIRGIIPQLVDNLTRRNLDTEILIDLLVTSKCPLEYVLLMIDSLSQKFIICNPVERHDLEEDLITKKRNALEIKNILDTGVKSPIFYQNLSYVFMINFYQGYRCARKMESCKIIMKHLPDWDSIINEEEVHALNRCMSGVVSIGNLQILQDCQVVTQIKKKFGLDLRACLFGNWQFDAIEFLNNQDFDINAAGMEKQTALHFAVKENLFRNVRFLLYSGANVEARNEKGRTPIFDCIEGTLNRKQSLQLLLEHEADVQITDNRGLTVFEIIQKENSSMLGFLIARLAINEAQGIPIKQKIQDKIDSSEDYKKMYDVCCQQLKVLKIVEVVKPVTLLTILTDEIDVISCYVRDKNFIPLLDDYKNLHELHSLYYSTMNIKLMKANKLYRCKCIIAEIISESIGKVVDFDHLVITKITDYLIQRDIDEVVKCFI